jgi:hypothetical protein
MNLDAYQNALSASGKLKIKATAKLALGTPDAIFEACVLLHEAARGELRAVQSIDAPAPTRLAALIEACGCLVDGFDPPGAAKVWAQITNEQLHVDPKLRDGMLAKLTPAYQRSQQQYATALGKLKVLRGMPPHPLSQWPQDLRAPAEKEASMMTRAFPGAAGWWWVSYRLAEGRENWPVAWDALGRARELDPEDLNFEAMSIHAAISALGPAKAQEHLVRIGARLDASKPLLCLMYALGEVRMARTESQAQKRTRWVRALAATNIGLSGQPTETQHKNLRAVKLLLDSYLANKLASVELLYLAGLSDVAVSAQAGADVEQLLSSSILQAA